MSEQPDFLKADPYPGYFPPAKPPFWTRTKVGAATGLVGLVIGLAAAPGGADSPVEPDAPKAEGPSLAEIQNRIDSAVDVVERRMGDKLATARDNAQQRLKEFRERAAASQRQAVSQAVARTRAQEEAKLRAAVADAKAEVRSTPPSFSSSGTSGGTTSSGTDPRFSYCYEANAAGYGPYYRGQDPEYAWYDDADNDGEVCE